jgi:hypothetical protein
MKNFAKLAAILLLLVAGPALWLFLKKSPQEKALHSRELATRRLAEHLARTLPGQRALVLSNPFAQARGGAILAQEEAGLRGLHQGFGKQIEIEAVVFPELKPEAQQAPESIELPPDATTPLSFMVTEAAFDKLAGQHPSCKLIVSLIGLPAELNRVELWQPASPVKFALLLPDLRVVGDTEAVRRAVKSGKITAMICQRPDAGGREVTGTEFDRQFLLVTAENIDEVLRRFPKLFGAALPEAP